MRWRFRYRLGCFPKTEPEAAAEHEPRLRLEGRNTSEHDKGEGHKHPLQEVEKRGVPRNGAVTQNRADVPYDIDGEVISVADLKLLESLGDVAMRPRGQIAWKFESEKAESKVLDVIWQVGPTGRVTPVAKIEPTKIGGVTIESVSLHNLKMFAELKLSHDCRVLIERRNDVIPYISKNFDNEES